MKTLIDNSEYRIKYLIKNNVDVYDLELYDKIRISYSYDRRMCFTKDKKGNRIPNPYFKPFEKFIVPFNLCYFLYAENTDPFPPDYDFEVGFNWSEIDFEEKISQIMKQFGYIQYNILNNELITEKFEKYSQDDFNGFVFSLKDLNLDRYNQLYLDCNDLNGIIDMMSLDTVLLMKAQYFANYNYIMYFNDKFDISRFISIIKMI
mgnify:CR=1 FL=1